MMSAFSEDALKYYKELPYETDELYKRYKLNFDISDINQNEPEKDIESLRKMAEEIKKNIKINFDAIIYNGVYIESEKDGLEFVNIEEIESDIINNKLFDNRSDKFAAFTHAYSKKALIIREARGNKLNILFLNGQNSLPLQIFINCKEKSKLTINEFYFSEESKKSVVGYMHEIIALKSSSLEISMLQFGSSSTKTFSLIKSKVFDEGNVNINTIVVGGLMFRQRNWGEAFGKESVINTNDLIIGYNSNQIDLYTNIRNAALKTKSQSTIRALMLDHSFGFIKGFAKINKGSKGAVSRIDERGLILDKDAFLYLIPDMSIDEGDVIATHSSSASPIEEEKIFYMNCRGISEKLSKLLIMNGMVGDIISKIGDKEMQIMTHSIALYKIKNRSAGIPILYNNENLWTSNAKG